MSLTVGSLFSGVGGLDLGLERAGMEIRWQVEIDEYCRKVLEKHWPDVRRVSDVKTFLADTDCELRQNEQIQAGRDTVGVCCACRRCADDYRVDLICGGFPCQPVSQAGRRRGETDERWLWPEFIRVIRILKPRWVLGENVPGLLSADAGRLFGGILRDLAESGYDAEWQCIPAAAVGAPHIRDRVFILAHADSRDRNGGGGPLQMGRLLCQKALEEHCLASRDQWCTEPDVGRVAHGISSRVDRLKSLGNAVVPQVAEWIGQQIMRAAEPEGGGK